jgi:hypothetical protein
MCDSKTTSSLLIFTLGPRRERARRRLLPTRLGALESDLHRRGLEAAIEAGRACACRVEVSSPDPLPVAGDVVHSRQTGEDFGQRLRRAIHRTEASNPDGPLLVIGTDIPGLDSRHLRRALEQLEDDPDRVVVGPSPDGGLYLLASRRPLAEVLDRVRWCRRDTLRTLLAALRAAGRPIALLPELADLDRPVDLFRWLRAECNRHSIWWSVRRAVLAALQELTRPAVPLLLGKPALAQVAVKTGRAPPF